MPEHSTTVPNVTLFGAPGASLDLRPVQLAAKEIALIAVLGCSRPGPHERTSLAELLWPQSSDRQSRHSLSQAIYNIRTTLHADALHSTPKVVSLGRVHVDAAEFTAHVRADRTTAAARLYRGTFLRPFDLNNCPEFDHWAEGMRSHYSQVAEDLVEVLHSQAAWPEVEALSSVLLEYDCENSRLWALRVHSLRHTRGRKHAMRVLMTAPIRVVDSARASYELIVQAETVSPEQAPRQFVGREREMEALKEQLLPAQRKPWVVLLEGEPGIGKTTLALRFAKSRALNGDVVLVAKAAEVEINLPFGVVDNWLRSVPDRYLRDFTAHPWWSAVKGLFPAAGESSSPDELGTSVDQRRILEALRRAFSALARDKPLIILLDDCNYADNASIAVLAYFLSHGQNFPFLLLLTTRNPAAGRASPFIERFVNYRLTLGPLSQHDTRVWLQRQGVASPDAEGSPVPLVPGGGNPALLSAWLETQQNLSIPSNPNTADSYFETILDAIPDDGKSALVALAIAGDVLVETEELARILGVNAVRLRAALDGLLEAGLVTESSEGTRLRHGIIGELSLAAASDSEKRRVHRRLARLKYRQGSTGPALAAISFDIAGDRPEAFEAALQAARACETLNAHDERLFFLKLAMSNAPTPASAVSVRVAASEVLLTLGRPLEALESIAPTCLTGASSRIKQQVEIQRLLIQTTLARGEDELRKYWEEAKSLARQGSETDIAELYARLGSLAHDLGSDALALKIAEEIREVLAPLPNSVEKSRLLLRPVLMCGVIGGYGPELSALDGLKAPTASDPDYRCRYHSTKAALSVSSGSLERASDDFARALAIAERQGLYDRLFQIHNNFGVCLMEMGSYAASREQLIAAQNYSSADTDPAAYELTRDNLSVLAFESGRHQEAIDLAEESFRTPPPSRRSALNRHSIIGLSSLRLSRLGRAREALRDLMILQSQSYNALTDLSYMHIFTARMRVLDGAVRDAVDALDTAAAAYAGRLALARWRIQLESCRLRIDGRLVSPNVEDLLREIANSGAKPLLQLAESLHRRSSSRAP